MRQTGRDTGLRGSLPSGDGNARIKSLQKRERRVAEPGHAGLTARGLAVGEHTVVTMYLVVKDERGRVLDEMYSKTPLKFAYGYGRKDLLPGLEAGIRGLKAGQRKHLAVPPEEAYGQRDPKLIVRIPRSELPSKECHVGELYTRRNEDGEAQTYSVMGFLENWVWLDRNHPWAGKELHYEVRIIEVRPLGEGDAEVWASIQGPKEDEA